MSMELIQKLRNQTGAGIMDVKSALDEAQGDEAKAIEILRKKGAAQAAKKAGREAKEGVVMQYIHMNRIGVLLELNCETDFVARTEDFQALAKELAMQVASMNPQYVNAEAIPMEIAEQEKEIAMAQIDANKPEEVKAKIAEGKMKKFAQENCLLDQAYFRDDSKTIRQLIEEGVGKMGENIQVRRFVRLSLDDADARAAQVAVLQ